MKKLAIIVAMAATVLAYKDRRDGALSLLQDFPPYQGSSQHPPYHEQHQPFREQSFKAQRYQTYGERPYRPDATTYSEQLPYKDQSLLGDYSSKRPFYGDRSSYKDAAGFKRESSFYLDGQSFKDQSYRDPAAFRNEPDQFNDQYSYQQQALRDDYRFSDLFDKSVNSYRDHGQTGPQAVSFRDSEYLKHGNHGLGYVSVPSISPYEDAVPSNEGTSTTMTPPTSSAPTHKPLLQSTDSSTARAFTQVHTSATSQAKMASLKGLHAATMSTVKSDTLANAPASTPAPVTVPGQLNSKQSSNLADPQTALTTAASLPVVATEPPIISFGRQTLPPIEFQAAKFSSSPSYYDVSGLKNKLQQSLVSYLLSQQAKSAIKNNEASSLLNYVLPDVPNNSLTNKIPSYILPGETKSPLKDNLQSSVLNYLLQHEPNRALSFQQSSLPEPVNYVPKITLPGVPIATLSAVSRPLQTMNYVPAVPTMAKVPLFMAQHSATTLPLASGASLASSMGSGIAGGDQASIFNSLPDGISGGISAGIAGNVPASIPATLNFGQNLQHVGQLRQFEALRSQPYSTGLQLQLGGFGGMDYSLRSNNPVPRSVDLGIAKVGLSLPELPRQQLPTFSKIGFQQHYW